MQQAVNRKEDKSRSKRIRRKEWCLKDGQSSRRCRAPLGIQESKILGEKRKERRSVLPSRKIEAGKQNEKPADNKEETAK
jgi:hypothetical protein